MPPPQLATDAPIVHILEPIEIDLGPALGTEAQRAVLHRSNRRLGERLHLHEPLLGDQRLDHALRAIRDGDIVRVIGHFSEQTKLVQLLGHGFARLLARHAGVLTACCVEATILLIDVHHRQLEACAALPVSRIVRRRDLDRTGAKVRLHLVVQDDRDVAPDQRQHQRRAMQVLPAFVVRVHRHSGIAEHRLGARSGHSHILAITAFHWVAQLVQLVLARLVVDLIIRDGCHQHAVPVDDARTAVDQAFLPQTHEALAHGTRQVRIHRELGARPIARGA